MTLLKVSQLRTSFHIRRGVVRAVDNVSFEIDAGETLGLVGESGCGKSVTALSLMRLVSSPPAEITGDVVFDGHSMLTLTDRQMQSIRGHKMAMIYQDPMSSLNPSLTVGRQVAEAIEAHLKMDRRSAKRRAIELLDLVGIPGAAERFDDYPHQFSGGMRQRVMIAMGISCGPKLVLADEITTGLDVTIQAQVLELLKRLVHEFKTSLILISHDLGVIAGMTQKVHVMYAGQIVEKASTIDLFSRPRMPYTWGLLRSTPRLETARKARLVPIEGQPPDLLAHQGGCRFAPRCPYARDVCWEREPDLLALPEGPPGQEVRCWGSQDVKDGGWLIGTDWAAVRKVTRTTPKP